MRITVSHCFVPVADYDEALGFYRDLLGLEERSNVAYEGSRWVTLSPPTQPDVQIVLTDPGSHPNASPADKTAAKELLAKGLLGALIFATDDCDATFDRLSSAGVDVLQEPIDQPYGVRDCALRDPSGNMVRFSQARTSQATTSDVPTGSRHVGLISRKDEITLIGAGDSPRDRTALPALPVMRFIDER